MFSFIKKIFSKKENPINIDDDLKIITIGEVRRHFDTIGTKENPDGYKENKDLIYQIESEIKDGRKNIFILDDICAITEILKTDLDEHLTKIGKRSKANIITLCSKRAGFDMLDILTYHPEIKVDYLITDIIFGGNFKINGKKLIIDGVDIALLAKELNNDLEYVFVTGNIISKKNVKTHNFAKKYSKYTHRCILESTITKDTDIQFDNEKFENIIKGL